MARMKKEYTAFNQNLKCYREQAGYSANEFAAMIGLTPNTYYAYETKDREPSFSILLKISQILHVSIDDMLGNAQDTAQNHYIQFLRSIGLNVDITDNGNICVTDDERNPSFFTPDDFVDTMDTILASYEYKRSSRDVISLAIRRIASESRKAYLKRSLVKMRDNIAKARAFIEENPKTDTSSIVDSIAQWTKDLNKVIELLQKEEEQFKY